MTKKEQGSWRLEIVIDIAFQILKILCGRKSRYRKETPQARNARKVNLGIEETVSCSTVKRWYIVANLTADLHSCSGGLNEKSTLEQLSWKTEKPHHIGENAIEVEKQS